MTRTYRIGVVLLAAAVIFAISGSPSSYGQRFRGGGESNQGNKEKKKDKDDDERKKNDNNNQGNNNQGSNNQGNNNQSGNKAGNNNQGGNNPSNNQGNQANQGNNRNNKSDNDQDNQGNTRRNFSRNAAKDGEAKKSGNSNVPSDLQPFIPGGKKLSDKDKKDSQGQNNQGQGGPSRFFNPGRDGGQGLPGNSQNQVIIGGSGNEPANRRLGRWKGDQWDGTRKVDNWSRVFGVKAQPFSSKWYEEHPSAWKYNNNKSNVWVVATVPGVYSWLGWGAVPQQYGVDYGRAERFDHSHYGDFYPLGVYSLMSGEEDPGTRVVQLAVDRHGHISGNYFDMITSANNAILGQVDRNTQRIEFWLNRNPSVRFYSSIVRMLQPYGSLTVHLPGGDQRWQFVRLEN